MKEISPFTNKLYDHHFDIDDLLMAFCGKGIVTLNTRTGAIEPQSAEDAHHFTIEPLPQSFVEEVKTSPKLSALNEEDKAGLFTFLQSAKIQDFPTFFEENSFAAGWLRERVKDTILEWLDMNNLIPPSMRHVRDSSAFSTLPNNPKIKIQLT